MEVLPESKIIDNEDLLHRFMGDQQIAREMLECFRSGIPELIEALHTHVAVEDQAAMSAAAQRIFNIAASCSAIAAQEYALQLEHAVITGNLESVRNILPQLDLKVFETIMAINSGYPESGPIGDDK
jgi:HPt (histidine-containing phosphotransfer) domain-containing protein